MDIIPPVESLPVPPASLASGGVSLQFAHITPGDPARGLVPSFHFRILTADGAVAGHINFRVGDTEHVRVCAGHIGFEITESFRGHHYALHACVAIAPFVRTIYDAVFITCDPGNAASRKTIERLGAELLGESEVTEHDPGYQRGARRKRRYRWTP